MMYLGDKAVGISCRALLQWDSVAQGTEDMSMFENVCLSDGITNIVDNAFSGLPIVNVTANSVKSIGTKSFYNCKNLSSISFENVESIANEAFRDCANKLTANHFHKLHTIGSHALRNSGIEYFVAPRLINIGNDALYSNSYLKCMDLGNKSIVSGFNATTYCFDHNAACIVILRYGYVLPATDLWFYSNCWLKNAKTPGTLYVWQELIERYQNHAVWGPLLASNDNQIIPIEGSAYETSYGDGTLIA